MYRRELKIKNQEIERKNVNMHGQDIQDDKEKEVDRAESRKIQGLIFTRDFMRTGAGGCLYYGCMDL